MSRASELMDSRKFMAAMDGLLDAWARSGFSDEQKAEALQAVLDMAMASPLAYGSVTKINDIIGHAEAVPMPPYLDMKPGKPRGIKALIPVPEVEPTPETMEKYRKLASKRVRELNPPAYVEPKPKRKRRTKAEMAAARSNPDGPLQEHEKIKPQSADEVQKAQAPHITAMLKKVQDRADAIQTPTFDVAFSREEGMFIQELPVYLEAGGRFGVIENRGFNPQYGWVVKIGRK